MEVRVSEDTARMPSDIAGYVRELCKDRKKMVVAVSGGSMPALLSGLNDIDISAWDIFFCDERLVPLDSDDSNFKACAFLTTLARVHAVRTDLAPEDALKEYERQFLEVGGRLDLAFLGCGPDGHTASLFPGHPIFADVDPGPFRLVFDSPKPPPARITFSMSALAQTEHIIYIAAGASKASLFSLLFQRYASSPTISLHPSPPEVPVAKIHGRISTVWFIDKAAAQDILDIDSKRKF